MTNGLQNGVVRTAVIGFGTAGRVFHAPFLSSQPKFALSMVCTSSAERAAHVAQQYPNAKVVASPQDVFAAADELDLVVIASPPRSHFSLAATAIEAGLAVVVDKPFVLTADEGYELIRRASQKKIALTVYQNRRWDDDFLTLQQLLRDQEFGAVHRFESRFEWWKPSPPPSWKTQTSVSDGGGILYDLGTHLIDQAIQLFGPVSKASADLARVRAGASADDDSFVELTHSSGQRSHLWMSSMAALPGPRFRVLGDAAGFESWGLDPQEASLAKGEGVLSSRYGRRSETAWGKVGNAEEFAKREMVPGDYGAFYRLLAEALLNAGPLPVDPMDSVQVIQLIEGLHGYSRPQ